jgi:hypothetical protein
MSFKAEVIADASGQWTSNALRFATEQEAKIYVDDLFMRWTAVRESRVVECGDLVNTQLVTDATTKKFVLVHRDKAA